MRWLPVGALVCLFSGNIHCRDAERAPAAPSASAALSASASASALVQDAAPLTEPVAHASAEPAPAPAPVASAAPAPPPDTRWQQAKAPAEGPAAAIGEYANGCLRGAEELPARGGHYVVMRPSRRRYFGHPNLIAFVRSLGESARRGRMGQVFVGDLAQPRGGPTLTGHASHQTGLDVDVLFLSPKEGGASSAPLNATEIESLPARAIVDLATNKLTASFHLDALKLVEMAAKDTAVERIFVHAAVKKKLCEVRPGQTWLGRVRPWWGHHDHFHVRLRCPEGNRSCTPQPTLPAGDGCDATLSWWFSAEAKAGPKKDKSLPPPPMPAGCEELVPPR